MEMWTTVVVSLHVLVALVIIGLVLLQHGKGADMGSGFGGGASGSLFGATGSANFLSRTTAVLAACFFASSLALAYLATTRPREAGSVVDRAPAVQPKAQPQKPEAQKGEAKSEKSQGAPESGAPAPAEKSVPQ